MKITTLASGSKGNCTLVETDSAKILIDAGISLQELESKLSYLGVNPKDISGIIVTHEHSDHIKSVGPFSRKYNCPIYASSEEWPILLHKIGNIEQENKKGFVQSEFMINDLGVRSFKLSHDSSSCYGYSFFADNAKFSIATDLGYAPQEVVNNLKDSTVVILEANHDERMLLNNPKYPLILKKRILSNQGHLSNNATSNVIASLVGGNLQQVILAHLSEENNSPTIAYGTIKRQLLQRGIEEGKHVFIDVASQYEIGHTFEIKKKK